MPRQNRAQFVNAEHEEQVREGRRLAAIEEMELLSREERHALVRNELDLTAMSAADRLRKIVEGSDDATKEQVMAANSILDRTGYAPERKVKVEKVGGQAQDQKQLLEAAAEALVSLPQEAQDALIEMLERRRQRVIDVPKEKP